MTTDGGPKRGSEEHTRNLEKIIGEQREHIRSLTDLREKDFNRKRRKRIAALERSLGQAALKIEMQKATIAYLAGRLSENGELADSPSRRAAVIHVPEQASG